MDYLTKHTVYVAGDIFQSIFAANIISEIEPDFLLSKCYRTDPRTLMFAHALGMGLFETPKLRWLEDNEWSTCGYNVSKSNLGKDYSLTREPLRRFEDLENENFTSVEIVKTSLEKGEIAETKIIEIIKSIRNENPTVLADDIAIIFIDATKNTYESADRLQFSIPREFGWKVNKAYETKQKISDRLFVSNKNHVKGLEFPFVICVTKKIHDSQSYRNALYMMLTRSFIKTHLLTSGDSNLDLIGKLEHGLEVINAHGQMDISAPSEEEKARIKTTITYAEEHKSHYQFVDDIFDELGVLPIFKDGLYKVIKSTMGESFDRDDIIEVAQFNYSKMSNS